MLLSTFLRAARAARGGSILGRTTDALLTDYCRTTVGPTVLGKSQHHHDDHDDCSIEPFDCWREPIDLVLSWAIGRIAFSKNIAFVQIIFPKNSSKYFPSQRHFTVCEIVCQAVYNPIGRWPSAASAELSDHRASRSGAKKLKSAILVQMI